jgi:uncharacterized damage-inducible protein DinB
MSDLQNVLDQLRESIAGKATGVPEPQVRAAGVPSGTSLLGLIKHLTHVERFYFQSRPITSMKRTFKPTNTETADAILAAYREAVRQSNEVVAQYTDLSRPAPSPGGRGATPTMQWTLIHMIEETARHAGHADILREQIDGATGR